MSPEERLNAAEAIARAFHEHHRRLAPRFGTRGTELSLWEELPVSDQQLRIAAASCVLDDMELASMVVDAVG